MHGDGADDEVIVFGLLAADSLLPIKVLLDRSKHSIPLRTRGLVSARLIIGEEGSFLESCGEGPPGFGFSFADSFESLSPGFSNCGTSSKSGNSSFFGLGAALEPLSAAGGDAASLSFWASAAQAAAPSARTARGARKSHATCAT